jgi:ubiquinone/menaquinone biosynthesis C-methylase UbiE
MAAIDSPLAVVRSVRWPITGLSILDIGCGNGAFARKLLEFGANVSGIDPLTAAIGEASAAAPQATFLEGVAEALPFGDRSFDLALMVNALHHVPEPAMGAALREAVRVVKPSGTLIVIEPLAAGSFFTALQLVEDETAVRRAAQLAIEAAVSAGELVRMRTLDYVRREVFGSVEDFLARITAVEPSRGGIIDRDRDAISAAVSAAAHRDDNGGLVFDQPIKADALEPVRTDVSA